MPPAATSAPPHRSDKPYPDAETQRRREVHFATWLVRSGAMVQRLAMKERLLLIGVLWVGLALRLPLLDRFPFHQDEAIYGYWARYARHVDPFFLHVWPDKPPLYLWLLSGTFELLGTTPAAARLLNIAISTLTIAAVAALARTWWGARAGVLAGLLLALNPFAISFAPTAFTDPLLVLAGMLALLNAVHRRFFWMGVWLGVAIMTKQQGVFFIPLALGFALYVQRSHGRLLHRATAGGVGFLLVVAPVVWWDSLRWAVAPSPWDLGARNAGGLTLAAPGQWFARTPAWLELGGYLLGSGWLWWLSLVLLTFGAFRRRQLHRAPDAAPALGLALWGAAFLALHIVTTVQIWDRYLLPLAPIVALLLTFALEATLNAGVVWKPHIAITPKIAGWTPHLLTMLLMAPLLWPAVQAAQGRLPIGGDHGAYTGLETVAAWLNDHADARPIVYQRNLGWHFQFYLFDTVQAGQADLRWYPSTVYLADNAAKTPHRPRYLVVADWSPERNLTSQLALRRLRTQMRLRAGNFTVYEVVEMATTPAPWRVCREEAQDAGQGATMTEVDNVATFAGFVQQALPQSQLAACLVGEKP